VLKVGVKRVVYLDRKRMEVYRSTSMGMALIDSLNTMIELDELTSEDATEILAHYERLFLIHYNRDVSKKLIPDVTIQVRSFFLFSLFI
jgi:hypothetical protein